MESEVTQYLLFPHTVLRETDVRHLSILLPNLSVLQVLRPQILPEWLQGRFSTLPTITEHERIAEANLALRGYREFAEIHGENATLASMSYDQIAEDNRESRFFIQKELGEREAQAPEKRKDLLLESAVFMELARDLDEKGMELEVGYSKIGNLEAEFREILGITSEEEILEAEGTLSPPLAHESSHLYFMLNRRMSGWLRLLSAQPLTRTPVLVAIGPEVLSIALEAIKNDRERNGRPPEEIHFTLPSITSLKNLNGNSFLELTNKLSGTNTLNSYWQELDRFLSAPNDAQLRTKLEENVTGLAEAISSFRKQYSNEPSETAGLSITYLPGSSLNDVWRALDPIGFEALGGQGKQDGIAFFCLS